MEHNSVDTGTIIALTILTVGIFVLGYAVGWLTTMVKFSLGKRRKRGRKC